MKITYTPTSESLAAAGNIRMMAYAYSKSYPTVFPADMEKQGKNWVASFTPDKNTGGVAFKFQSGQEVDNNNGQGYFQPLYGSDGNIKPSAAAGQAEALAMWGRSVLQIESNKPRAIELFNESFQSYPALKKDYFYIYIRTLASEKPDNWESMAMGVLDEITAQNNLDEETMTSLITAYRTVQQPEKADDLVEKAQQLFPKGYQVQLAEYQKFREEKDPEKQKTFLKAFKADFPESNMVDSMAYQIINGYINSDRFSDLKTFVKDNPEIEESTLLSRVASQLAAKEVDLNWAAELTRRGVEVAEKQLADPDSRPGYLTQEEWEKRIKSSRVSTQLYTLGQILEKLGKPAEALESLEEAVELAERARPEMNETYSRLLLTQNQPQKALDAISDAIKAGTATSAMKDLLKSSYTEVKGTAEGFDAYFEELENIVLNNMREELGKEIVDKPAPDFSLEDLEGNKIALSDLKGKVLVLDFWATWCGPCVRAFPAMNKAQEIFADDPDVEFLYINTWQKEEDKKANAQAFITKNAYPFHVLLDYEDKVVADYKVEGIPTKFIVDGKGRIRFKKIGFMGNDDHTIKELRLMIEMVK
jgi:peroxiredoxin